MAKLKDMYYDFDDAVEYEFINSGFEGAEEDEKEFAEKGYQIFMESPTNQKFIVLENSQMEKLKKSVSFSYWQKYDETHTVVRFATSWATKKEDVDYLLNLL